MPQPLVTFIIPAYNAAPYLRGCIDSVYAVDLEGHGREVIVVDDGSTDATGEVIARCREKYPTLLALRQENMGLSMARNAAMDRATGKYLCFVDADDRLMPGGEEWAVVRTMENVEADIIGVEAVQRDVRGRRSSYRRYVPIYNNVYAPARLFMRGRNLFPCVWAYLFRRDFIEEAGLRFLPGRYHEDEDFTVRAFALGETFMAVPVCWYMRRVRSGSITTTADRQMQRRRLRDVLQVMAGLEALAARDGETAACMRCKMDYLAVDILRTMLRQGHGKAFRREVVGALRGMGRFPLRWRWEPKYVLFNLLTRIIL